LKLGEKPLIALPLDDIDFEKKLELAKEKNIDIIEVRIDQFSNLDIGYILEHAKKVKENAFYLLATVRSEKEGGKFIPDTQRLKIFESVSSYADILDVELTSEDINEKVIQMAKSEGILSLVSYHDFEKTPDEIEIQKIINKAHNLEADIIKYAFKANCVEDIGRLLSMTHRNRDKNLVAISMGELGKISRVAGFFFGSLISYTYIGKSFAPGQIEADKLIEELKFYNLY
jgi:3-dehydroquinate dehydratase-1